MFLRLLVSLLAGHIPGGCEERGRVAGFSSYPKMPLTSELPQLIRARIWVPIQECTKGLSGHSQWVSGASSRISNRWCL